MLRTAYITSFAGALLAMAVCSNAHADPTNYQRYVIGERSLGMAGAYAAAANDSMAIYYNPGALVFAGSTAVSASKSVYAADHRNIEDGFVPNYSGPANAVDLDNSNDLTWPSTLTFMTSFGKKKKPGSNEFKVRHAIGFAMLVPHQEDYSFRGKFGSGHGVTDTETYFFAESFRTAWTGVSYAIRPHRKLGFGLSVFWSNYRYYRRYDSNYYNPPGDTSSCHELGCGELKSVESILRTKTNSIIFRVGILWRPKKRWRLGLTVTPPSILMPKLSDGSLDQTLGTSSTTSSTNVYSRLYTDDYSLTVDKKEPTSIRLGMAYSKRKAFTVDLDLTAYLPVSYDRIKGDPVADRLLEEPDASLEWFDPSVVKQIDRKFILNVNLGGEIIFPKGFTVRTGLFTDFSSAPKVTAGDEPQLNKVHRLGGAFSIGHRGKNHDIAIGVIGTYGRGKASVYQPDLARGPDDPAFLPQDYNERSIYVFISGFQQVLEQSTEKLIKKIVD